jgi:hypothetical protein
MVVRCIVKGKVVYMVAPEPSDPRERDALALRLALLAATTGRER